MFFMHSKSVNPMDQAILSHFEVFLWFIFFFGFVYHRVVCIKSEAYRLLLRLCLKNIKQKWAQNRCKNTYSSIENER